MHDPRLGRFFSVDPLTGKYAYNSPYAFAENKVIQFVELEGLETPTLPSYFDKATGNITTAIDQTNTAGIHNSAEAAINFFHRNSTPPKTPPNSGTIGFKQGSSLGPMASGGSGFGPGLNDEVWRFTAGAVATGGAQQIFWAGRFGVNTTLTCRAINSIRPRTMFKLANGASMVTGFTSEFSNQMLATNGDLSKFDYFDLTVNTIFNKNFTKSFLSSTIDWQPFSTSDQFAVVDATNFKFVGLNKSFEEAAVDFSFNFASNYIDNKLSFNFVGLLGKGAYSNYLYPTMKSSVINLNFSLMKQFYIDRNKYTKQ